MSEEKEKKLDVKSSTKKTTEKNNTKKKSKASLWKKMSGFFKDSLVEIKKIVWPKPKMVFKNMGIVLAVISVIGVFVFLLDTGLSILYRWLMDFGG